MYRQITYSERYTVGLLRRKRFSVAAIARVLGRHRSTIMRELRRNRARSDGMYRSELADWYARGRRSRSRRNGHFSTSDYRIVERLLKKKWSPEQIAGRLRLEGNLSISHETIYRYVWSDKEAGGDLYAHLRCSSKIRRKRHNSYDSRGRLAGKRHISERPSWVEKRASIGHWEVDTVVGTGSKDCVATLVERKTGFAMVGKLRRSPQFRSTVNVRLTTPRAQPGSTFPAKLKESFQPNPIQPGSLQEITSTVSGRPSRAAPRNRGRREGGEVVRPRESLPGTDEPQESP